MQIDIERCREMQKDADIDVERCRELQRVKEREAEGYCQRSDGWTKRLLKF